MNHVEIIRRCRMLLAATDKPSAGLDLWNEAAEVQMRELRLLLVNGEPSRQRLAESMQMLIGPVREILTVAVKLNRFKSMAELPGSSKELHLASQPCAELDAAIMKLSQAVSDALHHVKEAEQEAPASAAG